MFQENLEQLFLNELTDGINLFLGAGFSKLPDSEGEIFPDANELCEEICQKFSIDDIFKDDLYSASELIPKIEYQNYLRERFTIVNKINDKYNLLDKININCIVTTNIDNLIKTIFSGPHTEHYLFDSSVYGNIRKNDNGIKYIALNGDVTLENSHLYFGKFDLSVVEKNNKDLYDMAKYNLSEKPVFFWGYSFSDVGVQKIVKYLIDNNKQSNIWVQCQKNDLKQIRFFEALGCKIIKADTEELFNWIETKYIPENDKETETNISDLRKFDRYKIPKPFSIETYSKEDYYRLGVTNWFSIYNNQAYETKLVDEIWSLSLTNKNLVILGSQFAGKTTALMQCAVKRNKENVFYFLGDTPKEEAEFFLNSIASNVIVFLQDAHKDIETFCSFALSPKVKLIATADKYSFDNVKHIVSRNDIDLYQKTVSSIDRDTARRIYDYFPNKMVRSHFTYRENSNEEYSFLELLGQNIRDFATYESVKKILKNIYTYDSNNDTYGNEIQLVALTVYLEQHFSLMSTDLFFSFFDFYDYFDQIVPLREKVKGLLNEAADISIEQDYFSIRSKFFLKHAHSAFILNDNLRMVYKYVISRLIKDVYKGNIFRYDLFKRKAYDSKLFYKVFCDENDNRDLNKRGADGLELYDTLYYYDESPYTLQQKALYLSLNKRSKEAFSVIDDALNKFPNNFSMKNSKAEIIFQANKSFNSEQAKEQILKSIKILEECKKNDKKQDYHAILYAKIVLHLNEYFDGIDESLVATAIEWLTSIASEDKLVAKLLSRLNSCVL